MWGLATGSAPHLDGESVEVVEHDMVRFGEQRRITLERRKKSVIFVAFIELMCNNTFASHLFIAFIDIENIIGTIPFFQDTTLWDDSVIFPTRIKNAGLGFINQSIIVFSYNAVIREEKK